MSRSVHSDSVFAGVVVVLLILFCGAGFAGIMGWIPTTTGGGDRASQPTLDRLPAAAVYPQALPAQVSSNAPAATPCGRCGAIESVRVVEQVRNAAGGRALAGSISGAALGQQLGGDHGRDLMTVLGIVVGAMFGNQVEKDTKTITLYEIAVRFEDGSSRVLTQVDPPAWKPGDRVKVINGRIQSNA